MPPRGWTPDAIATDVMTVVDLKKTALPQGARFQGAEAIRL
jgi:hypothetical protein